MKKAYKVKRMVSLLLLLGLIINWNWLSAQVKGFNNDKNSHYDGTYFSGIGDTKYLALLDSAYMMMQPNPRMENLSMLYDPEWNGFVEGPTWNAWWIQNSFGPTFTMLPFMNKAYQTFVFNSQALWFDHIGNGIRKGNNGFIGPKGVLCDAATPKGAWYKQGDGKVDKHDWCYGFTTAGVLLESELMLIRRDKKEIEHYLPLLEESADFIDSRRDPSNNMFLVGPAANLLAPSYAGTGKLLPDGSYGKAYLAEISINYIAALNRLIEVEKIMKRKDKVKLYTHRIELIEEGLSNFITPEGYFVRSIDPDGTKHGVYGAPVHGYFASSPNCDAMAFRIVNDYQAKEIYDMIRSIPELRPYKLIIPNYPSYDDMYEYDGIFQYGTWVNGGEWATEEAFAQMGYYRVGAYHDAEESFQQTLKRANNFRLDNPLTHFGSKEYQPNKPINCVYDCWGVPGGFLRGIFEYIYTAKGLRLYPHIPLGIKRLQQKFPVYFGKKKIFITVNGNGSITSVKMNGKSMKDFNTQSLFLKLDNKTENVTISIGLGNAPALAVKLPKDKPLTITNDKNFWNIDALRISEDTLHKTPENKIAALKNILVFYNTLVKKKLAGTYEGKHAELILRCVQAIDERKNIKDQNMLPQLPLRSRIAADDLYINSTLQLSDGLIAHLNECLQSNDKLKRNIAEIWLNIGK